MTTTTDAIGDIGDIVDSVFPELHEEQADEVEEGDPRLTDLVWALCLSAGRIPLLP